MLRFEQHGREVVTVPMMWIRQGEAVEGDRRTPDQAAVVQFVMNAIGNKKKNEGKAISRLRWS
jgi:hypothetical protein